MPPASIPDLLALVGDTADGFPGLPGWGAKSAAACSTAGGTSRTSRPTRSSGTPGCGAAKLNATLRERFELALLFRRIATVETDAEVGTVDRLAVDGPTDDFVLGGGRAGDERLVGRPCPAEELAAIRRPTSGRLGGRQAFLGRSLKAAVLSLLASLGRPRTRSPMMLRWIWSVPP